MSYIMYDRFYFCLTLCSTYHKIVCITAKYRLFKRELVNKPSLQPLEKTMPIR